MTVLNDKTRINHVGDGVTRTFTYDFPVLKDTHLQVFVGGVLKTLGTHYSIGGIGQSGGGDVTFTVGATPADAASILFLRVVPVTQETEYPVGSKFPSKSHEDAVDKLTMIVQQLTDGADKAITLPPSELVPTLDLVIHETAAQRAGRIVAFKSDGLGVETILGPPPAAHAASHQNGGGDEISVAGLSGVLADPQTPAAHASSHQSGGGDAIKLDDLAAPDDNTDLDASTTKHGLLKKLPGGTVNFLRADGAFAEPPGSGGIAGGLVLVQSQKDIASGIGTVTGTLAETSLYAWTPNIKWTKYSRMVVGLWGLFTYGGGASEVTPIFKLITLNNVDTPIVRIQWNTLTINGGTLASPRTMLLTGFIDTAPSLLAAGVLGGAVVEGLVGQAGVTVFGQSTPQWKAAFAVDPDLDDLFNNVPDPAAAVTCTLSNSGHTFKLQRVELWGLSNGS